MRIRYLSSVAWIRFFSFVRMPTIDIRLRVNSRWSRSSAGGIHTVGSVPLYSSRASPSASSLSVLLMCPAISLAFPAWASFGTSPADSISETIQYQLPIVSKATTDPGGLDRK